METVTDRQTTAPPAEHSPATPQREHQWLQQLVGEWSYESEVKMAEGAVEKSTGTEIVRSLGGLWIVAEGEGEMPCQPGTATTMMTIGYDPQKQRYVGTWVGSMMTYLWPYEGELDFDRNVLTLESEGPDMVVEGKVTKYRDAIELKDADHRVMTSYVLDGDGKWQLFMTSTYRRKA